MAENSEGICKAVHSTSINGDRSGRLNVSRTGLNAAQGRNWFGKPTAFTCKNEGVEMAFREYLRMRRSDLYRDGNFKLGAKWGKCLNVLGGGLC
jgi:hypothetical protein